MKRQHVAFTPHIFAVCRSGKWIFLQNVCILVRHETANLCQTLYLIVTPEMPAEYWKLLRDTIEKI
jgi:hypothetical protein